MNFSRKRLVIFQTLKMFFQRCEHDTAVPLLTFFPTYDNRDGKYYGLLQHIFCHFMGKTCELYYFFPFSGVLFPGLA